MANDHISTAEIEQDILDTEREIAHMEREEKGLRLIGDKLSCYRADARRDGIKQRQAFIAKLRGILNERTVDCLKCGKPIPHKEGICPHCGYVEFRDTATPDAGERTQE